MKFWFLPILCVAFVAHAQVNFPAVTPSKLPEVLPPTPEVASIVKGAELSANLHTGTANASIPLYTISLKDYNFPIGLNYSSNGLVVNEICSIVGHGWNLNAGGVINRIVQGKPDDFCTFPTPVTASDITGFTQAAYAYLDQVADVNKPYDCRPDLYKFSVNGVYGSFFILRDNTVLQFPYSNNKINVIRSGGTVENYVTSVQITDDKGIQYLFEDFIESTYDHNIDFNYLGKKHIKTAWFLKRILLPNSQYIQFNYTSATHISVASKTETIQKGLFNPEAYLLEDSYGHTTEYSCPVDQTMSAKETIVKYNSFLLNNIYASDGTSVTFNYENRSDGSGDKRLIGMNVYNQLSNTQVKAVSLTYLNNTNHPNFFLKKVSITGTGTPNDTQDFEMSYTGNEELPPRFSGQDHLGFYNGTTRGLLPYVSEYADLFGVYAEGNRDPNGQFAQIGMLDKITYPTGGYTKFNYEPNLKSYWGNIPNTNLTLAYIEGAGPANPPSVIYSTDFSAVKNETRKLHFSTEWHGTAGQQDDGQNKTAFCRFKDLTTGSIRGYSINGYDAISPSINLLAGHDYRIEIEVRNLQGNFAKAYIDYDNATGTHWGEIREELCGIRVKSLANYDPISKKSTNKFYNYNFLVDTIHPSAIQEYGFNYVSDATNEIAVNGNINSQQSINTRLICKSKVISSNNNVPAYNSAGAVTYQSVIESDDINYTNGGIAHIFKAEGGLLAYAPILGYPNPDGILDPDNSLNGAELETIFFDATRKVQKKITNEYATDTRYYKEQLQNYIARKRHELTGIVFNPLREEDFRNMDVQEYPIYRKLKHLVKTKTEEFVAGSITPSITTEINYTYATINNINPSTIEASNSKNVIKKQVLTYPNELPGTEYTQLTQKNIIGSPVITEVLSDNNFLQRTSIEYKDWFNDGSILKPLQIKEKKGSNQEYVALVFDSYDNLGNVLTMSKKDDVKQSIMWNYQKMYPVAQIKNATEADGFAYTSFEGDDNGKWNFGSVTANDLNAVTGVNTYSLNNGSVSLNTSFIIGKNYVVTVWANSNNFSISNISPTMIATGRNGWNLYTVKFNNLSSDPGIYLSGTASIDELRFYPSEAFITTYAYKPGVGTIHSNDENNKIVTYEYDNFNRLKILRDQAGNVVKQYEYAYKHSEFPCVGGFAPNWIATGPTRCQVNVFSNTFTGYQEQEEKDTNPCSDSYNVVEWHQVGPSTNCAMTICKGAGKRMVNGVCETGTKVFTASKYLGNLQWQCTYHYLWSDQSVSPSIVEINAQPCTVIITEL